MTYTVWCAGTAPDGRPDTEHIVASDCPTFAQAWAIARNIQDIFHTTAWTEED
jgi:hypothetical protein